MTIMGRGFSTDLPADRVERIVDKVSTDDDCELRDHSTAWTVTESTTDDRARFPKPA